MRSQVSRCVMENLPGIYANPVEGKNEVIVFDSHDDIDEKCFKATILLLLESFGLGVVFYDKSREDDDNSTESNPEITRVEYNFDDVIDCLLSFISHKVLDTTVWKAFASDGQKNGIYAKVSEDGPTFLDVVALKGFTINSDGKSNCIT